MEKKLRVGALISGGGTNLQAIIDACEAGEIDAKMAFVGSDNPDAYGLKRAQTNNIPTFVVGYRAIIRQFKEDPKGMHLPDDFDLETLRKQQNFFSENAEAHKVEMFLKTRAIAESALLEETASYSFDLLVLAGFMRNLTPYFINKVNTDPALPRIMNIHPALLPSFPGVDGYGDTFRYGCKTGGCTVHFIDYGEDTGPIIGQKAYPILPDDTLESIKEKGLKLEWELYPECIQLYAEGRLSLEKHTYRSGTGKDTHRTIVKIKSS